MAILGKVAGTMLKDNLLRNGVDLIIDSNLMYYDISNRRIGINTITPGNALTVNGSFSAANVLIANNVIQSFNGNLILNSSTGNIAASNLRISNIAAPLYNSDATNKNYVDSQIELIRYPNLYVGNSNTGNTNVLLGAETLNLVGNTNQLNVTITENTATFSLTSNVVIGNLNTTNGGQIIGYMTGPIGANVANTGVFTSVTTVNGGQITGYMTGAIGANTANSGAFTTVTASSTATFNAPTAISFSAQTIGNSGATIQGDTVKSLNGGQITGYLTGAIGANTPNTGVFTSVTTVSGGQLTGYHTGPIGANTPNTVVATAVTTTSGGQLTGYHTGAIGANTPNTGVFTNVTTTGSSGNISGANYIFASLFSGNLTGAVGNINPNSGVFTSVTTVNGGQLTGYLTGVIGANTANAGTFTTLTATSGYSGPTSGPMNGTLGATTPNTVVATSVTTTSGGQLTGYHTGAIGANTANTGVFTSVTTTNGGQLTGYLTGVIGANTANAGTFTTLTATSGYSGSTSGPMNGTLGATTPNSVVATSVTTVSGGQIIGYVTGPIGANTANTGVFTTLTATSGYSGSISGPMNGTLGATTPNSVVATLVTTVSGGQLTGYLTGAIGANTANTGVFTTVTSTSSNIGNFYIHDNTVTVTNTDGNVNLTPIGNGIVAMNTATALKLPSGNYTMRPANPNAGMLRFNSVDLNLEFFDGYEWLPIAATAVTTIISDTFVGTGSQYNFTLSQASTTGGTLVTINGVIQIPDVAYTVSGSTLTFYEAPLTTDVIEARLIITTSTITSLHVGSSTLYFDSPANNYAITMSVNSVDRMKVNVANTTVYNDLVVGNNVVAVNSANVSLVQNTPTTISSFPLAYYRTGKYVVSISDFSGSKFESAEILVNHNGTTASATIYGVVTTGGSNFATFSTAVSGSNVLLQANSSSVSSYCNVLASLVTV